MTNEIAPSDQRAETISTYRGLASQPIGVQRADIGVSALLCALALGAFLIDRHCGNG